LATLLADFPNARLVRTYDSRGVYEGVQSGNCTIGITSFSAWTSYQYDASVNGDCSLEWIGRSYKFVPAGFATKADSGVLCTSLLRDVINLFMDQMKADGFVDNGVYTLLDSLLRMFHSPR
jgi:hypothetical protein